MQLSALFQKRESASPSATPGKNRHVVRKVVLAIAAVILLVGGIVFWKAESFIQRISFGGGSIFEDVFKSLPGIESKLKGEGEGRVNIALLGMRGEEVAGGGLLADTIMVLSIHPSSGESDQARASLVSVPRDLQVTVPDTSDKQKINAVHFYGEQKGKGMGMEYMKRILSDVTGVPIHYAVTIDFKGFTDLVDALGGITVQLEQPFLEGLQFHEPQVCDPYTYTVPAYDPVTKLQLTQDKWYVRKDGTKYLAKSYPLCYNKDEECGGVFKLPVGDNVLDGENALCYARARYGSSDFERAKRQQQVIQRIKDKALSTGTLTDFEKINSLLDSLGDNVRTDMEGWEMKRMFELYQKIGAGAPLTQKVLDTTEEGLLYHPENADPAVGYILLPRGDNYDRIHSLFQSLP